MHSNSRHESKGFGLCIKILNDPQIFGPPKLNANSVLFFRIIAASSSNFESALRAVASAAALPLKTRRLQWPKCAFVFVRWRACVNNKVKLPELLAIFFFAFCSSVQRMTMSFRTYDVAYSCSEAHRWCCHARPLRCRSVGHSIWDRNQH